MRKALLLGSVVAVLLLVSLPVIYASDPPPTSSRTKDPVTKVTLEVRELSRTVSVSAALPVPDDFWIYITNPSNDISRTTLTSVDIFGDAGNFAVPAHELLIDQIVYSDAGPPGSTVGGTATCTPPQAATSAGQFPTKGSCTGAFPYFSEYRFAFRGWGQTAVAPLETTLIWFVGFSGYTTADIGHHDITFTVTYTFEGTTYVISTSIHYSVVA